MGITIDHGESLADIARRRYSKSNCIWMKKNLRQPGCAGFSEDGDLINGASRSRHGLPSGRDHGSSRVAARKSRLVGRSSVGPARNTRAAAQAGNKPVAAPAGNTQAAALA